jgi:4-hydroxybenzoate polyprenyltransferase
MISLRPYAQLVRLPNLPSALADIGMAGLASGALQRPGAWLPFVLLLLASASMYTAGMALNDVFDVEQDARERPERPIPSGRVSRRRAAWLGALLLGSGVLLALAAGGAMAAQGQARDFSRPAVIAVCLAGAILLYDGWLKRTWLGPLVMGSCRFFNVLLGLSLAGASAWALGFHLAGVVGLYIVGVTWFARTEARESSQAALAGAATVMLAALLLAVPLPLHDPPDRASVLFPYLLVALGFVVGLPVSRAIGSPTSQRVQAGVRRALLGLILLDAVLATARAGALGLVLLVLLLPALYLNRRRWLYAT